MAKSIHQHIVPKVYLKYFSDNNFVHVVNFKDPFRKNIQRKGIGDKVFCRKKYYDFPNKHESQYVEDQLSGFEGYYNEVVKRLTDRSNLGYDTKQLIINWLHVSKIRNTHLREHMSELIGWVERTKYGLVHGAEAMRQREAEFARQGSIGGKLFQLENFINEKSHNEIKQQYSFDLLKKEWTILVSKQQNFITNDNPGFSYTLNPDWMRLGYSPLTKVFNLSDRGLVTHFFPLAPTLCLMTKPFPWTEHTTEKEIEEDVLRNIAFDEAATAFVDLINKATIECANGLLIARDKADIEKYIEDAAFKRQSQGSGSGDQ